MDLVIQLVLLILLLIAGEVGAATLGGPLDDDALVIAIATVAVAAVLIGYPTVMETLARGRSLGKLAMGLRVVRDDGGPVRFRHALVRAMVGLSVEWPGLLMPLVTWVASLWTMLVNPHGKRLGDLAAGTIVIHERSPAVWGWVPAMPAPLAGWASTLDLTGLGDDLALAVRHYLARNREIREPYRSRLGFSLASEVAAVTTPQAPPGTPGWAYLAAVLAERNRRSVQRLTRARAATAAVWPELAREVSRTGWVIPESTPVRPSVPG